MGNGNDEAAQLLWKVRVMPIDKPACWVLSSAQVCMVEVHR